VTTHASSLLHEYDDDSDEDDDNDVGDDALSQFFNHEQLIGIY
jgi:hypothetical protein